VPKDLLNIGSTNIAFGFARSRPIDRTTASTFALSISSLIGTSPEGTRRIYPAFRRIFWRDFERAKHGIFRPWLFGIDAAQQIQHPPDSLCILLPRH
jgi:hypothetical protein